MMMGQKTATSEQLDTIKAELLGDLAILRDCVGATVGIEGLEHCLPAMQRIDTFAILALRVMACTPQQVILSELQALQVHGAIANMVGAANIVAEPGHG